MTKKQKENFAKLLFFICALMSVFCLVVISFYIFIKGVPAILEIGIGDFLLGTNWQPQSGYFGIFNMIISSFVVTAFAFLFASFIGKWAAIFLSKFCPKKIYGVVKPMVELLAGIPSVIYGFFGVVIIVPIIRDTFGGPGKSMFAAIVILTIMILPTIITLSEAAIKSVPESYYEGAIALGATHTEAVFNIVVPAAKSGIRASFILGIGRAIGETMAVILVAGNSIRFPNDFLMPVRTLTSGIALEMGYASGLHQSALFGIGVVLFVIILILNIILNLPALGKEK